MILPSTPTPTTETTRTSPSLQATTSYNQRFELFTGNSTLIKFLQNSSHFSQGNAPQNTIITPLTTQIPDSTPIFLPVPSTDQTLFTTTRFKISPTNKNTGYLQAVVNPVLPGGKTQTGDETGKNVVDANNRFAFALYTHLNKNNAGKNIFFSPFSISTVFALVYEGARGSTADQIQSVFHYPKDDAARRSEYSTIIDGLNDGNSGYTLRVADALWAEKRYAFLPEYTSIARNYYDAGTINLDFHNQPENSRITINRWVDEKTNDKIKDLLPGGSITEDTKLVITNAIYFKGTWVRQFSKSDTKEDKFYVTSAKPVKVQMMQNDAYYRYAETSSMQAIEMPYTHEGGKELSMLVVLPKGTTLTAVENSLTGNGLADLEATLDSQRVIVFFPKFKLETKYSLANNLKALGMPIAFSDKSDLSGMDGTRHLILSDAIHKAYIDLNEEGTEAAAATAIEVYSESSGIGGNEPPIPVFRADHPFIFFIQDRDTGAILFMGRMMNPVGS